MSKFTLTKKIQIGEALGEGHDKDYITVQQLTYKDAMTVRKLSENEEESADKVLNVIKEKFVDGKVTDEASGNQVDITKDDLEDLPVSVFVHCVQSLAGGVSENLGKA